MQQNRTMKNDLAPAKIAGALAGVLFTPMLFTFFPSFFIFTWYIAAIIFGIVGGIGACCVMYIFRVMSRRWETTLQAGKFCVVGVLNVSIDLFVVWLLILLFGKVTGIAFAGMKAISFIVGTTNSYFWNKWWTFQSEHRTSTREYVKFFTTSIIGGIINVSVATVVATLAASGGPVTTIIATIAALIATAVSLAWNFLSYRYFVFRVEREDRVQS